MSDDVKKPEHPFLQVELLDEGKEVRVTCNISNLTIGLGLCEVAKDFIRQKIAMDNKKAIHPANGNLMDHIRRLK